MKFQSRFWIELNGERVFGKGPYILIREIQNCGSMNKAAENLNMSYSKANKIVKRAETNLGFKILEREQGGINGGGSYITPKGTILLEKYEEFCREAEKSLEEIFNKHLKDIYF